MICRHLGAKIGFGQLDSGTQLWDGIVLLLSKERLAKDAVTENPVHNSSLPATCPVKHVISLKIHAELVGLGRIPTN